MRIGIDARFLTHPQRGGFKTYTENLVAALAEIDAENEYTLYVDRLPEPQTKLPGQENFIPRIIKEKVPIVGMPWREQVSLSRQVQRDRLDLLHAPCLTSPLWVDCPLAVTIHDVIWAFPHRFSNGDSKSIHRLGIEKYYQVVPKFASRQADVILTVSQAAKKDLIGLLGLPAQKIHVTSLAANRIFRKIQDETIVADFRKKNRLPSTFILAIGAADPRKNLSSLVEAYALLPGELRERYPLVIVWAHPHLAKGIDASVAKLGIGDQVLSRPGGPNEEMVLLYNAASLFVFPSRYEGFGLPPLEAMACGTPVIAADNSSIPEVAGEAAVYCGAEDIKSMAQAMGDVLTDPALRQRLIEKGLRRAEGFSWQKCGQETLAAYRSAISVR